MLAAIFSFQAGLFGFALWKCGQIDPARVSKVCPEVGKRYDSTFGIMIATVLALLGASKSDSTPG